MYVYIYWTNNDGQFTRAFKRPETAFAYVHDYVSGLVATRRSIHSSKKETLPEEFIQIEQHLITHRFDKTLLAAEKLISKYEDYCGHCLGEKSIAHMLKDVKAI